MPYIADKISGRAMYISPEGTTWHSSCFGDWHHVMALIDDSCCCKMCCFRRDRQILARLLRLSNLQTEHHSPPQRGRVAQWTLCRSALDGIGGQGDVSHCAPSKAEELDFFDSAVLRRHGSRYPSSRCPSALELRSRQHRHSGGCPKVSFVSKSGDCENKRCKL